MRKTAYKVDFGQGNYKDEGCEDGEFPSCLNCPLAMCKYEKKTRKTSYAGKYPEVVRMLSENAPVLDIVKATGLKARTVYHVKEWLADNGVI
jgi:hypothetical protein